MACLRRPRGRRARVNPSSSGLSDAQVLSMFSSSSASFFTSNNSMKLDVMHAELTAAQFVLMIMLSSVNLNTLAADALAAEALCSVPPPRGIDSFFYDQENSDQGLSGFRSRDKGKALLCDPLSSSVHATRSKCKAVKSLTPFKAESQVDDGDNSVASEGVDENDSDEFMKMINAFAACVALHSEEVFNAVTFFSLF
ncbi:hypothetical protein AJ78_04281 [Emergomyces pasteurianus Ep9510]|uniref:Uncharacterized protein n=1 Tax=Emergomyces pasteurianus Ep9510 TaxID=1447872 RepID=A0A1J9PGB5_9EURO|nr:hypothetical protein AJ78_04281 [Emergomyces pasteurianus Ep9510]